MTHDREELRAAIAGRVEAEAALAAEQTALERVSALVSASEAALGEHATLPDRVAAHRGAGIAAWARTGAEGAAPAVELSPALAAERQLYAERRAALGAARSGFLHQQAERDRAAETLRQATATVSTAAEKIVCAHLDEIERRWSAAVAESDRLGAELHAGSAVWLTSHGTSPRPLNISMPVRGALRQLEDRRAAPLMATLALPGRHPRTASLQLWHARLCSDADAALDGPPEPPAAAAEIVVPLRQPRSAA